MSRFKFQNAERCAVPLWIGLTGPSGTGKTYSALRLATGIQRVVGGDIAVIDTEACRAKHYAFDPETGTGFRFQHCQFDPPFGPLDYLGAVEAAAASGAKVCVIDSMSHEHEGQGGVLEQHASECVRLARKFNSTEERMKMSGWAVPKASRRKLINAMLQMPMAFILCFRSKEKLKIVPGEKPLPLGWMPIGGDEFAYECTAYGTFHPGADGVPSWRPTKPGEQLLTKLPRQFAGIIKHGDQMNEDMGEAMARWAQGGAASTDSQPSQARFGKSWRKEWAGKALADAPGDVLADYRNVLLGTIENPDRSRYHASAQRQLDAVDAAIAAQIEVGAR
jgi:hypothetical protein